MAAGIYAGRKKLKTLLITDNFGGQSIVSAEIQNWVGTKTISGFELAKNLEGHLRAQEGVEIIDGDLAEKLEKINNGFRIFTKQGKKFETKTILVVSGSRRRKLGVPGEKEFDGKGVVYCATCDAPLFGNKTVAVVGSGNAGLEAARDLLSYAKKVYLLEFLDKITGDQITFDGISKNPKLEVILSAEVKKVLGGEMVTGLEYLDRKTDKNKELELDGIFVEIGSVPNSNFVKELVELNKRGEIVVDCKTQMSSMSGIWAAGDVCDSLYKQNNIAAGDAIKAVLNISEYLNKK